MKKKLFLLIIALAAVLLSPSAFAQDNGASQPAETNPMADKLHSATDKDLANEAAKYRDIGKHWGKTYISKLSYLGIVNGNGDGTFNPDGKVTVAQFIAMTVRVLGYRIEQGKDYWAEPYIAQAKADKLISDTEFSDYNRPITREEMAKIIFNTAMLREPYPAQNDYEAIVSRIKDFEEIDDMKKQPVINDYILGLLKGSAQIFRFNPKAGLTRAEACTVIARLLDKNSRETFPVSQIETVTLPGPWDGKGNPMVTVYPPEKTEVITTAKVMIQNISKSLGGARYSCNPEEHLINASFYANQDMHVTDMQMAFTIQTYNHEYYMKCPYDFVIYDADAVKKLHRGFVVEMFKYFFGNDADKAIAQFDYYLSIANDNSIELKKVFYYNGRKLRLNKFGNDTGFSMFIHSKN